jgi:hypothetical protein
VSGMSEGKRIKQEDESMRLEAQMQAKQEYT